MDDYLFWGIETVGANMVRPWPFAMRAAFPENRCGVRLAGRRGSSEVPLCAATPQNVEITGLAPADIIGIHTYCRDDVLEIIDARYLTRLPKIETAVETVSEAKP